MTGLNRTRRHRQRGVAVITALLLTTLAITIVASLFWQQQVQVRSIENQRLQLQKQWVLRGALDWARLILREDRRISGQIDHLGEPWSVPLAPTRLDQYVEEDQIDADMGNAQLAGGIIDAQSRFNLQALAKNGERNQEEFKSFRKLLENLSLDPNLANAVAALIEKTQERRAVADAGGTGTGTGTGTNAGADGQPIAATTPTVQVMPLMQVDDLLAIPEMKPEFIDRLRDFVVFLPDADETAIKVNANTASAEVLSARIDTLSLSDAKAVIAQRERAYFRQASDLGGGRFTPNEIKVGFSSNFFLVNGKVQLGRGYLEMLALIQRSEGDDRSGGNSTTRIIWVREN